MSMHSPKHKFSGEIHFDKPVPGTGSVVSYTADNIEQIKSYFEMYNKGYVVIRENKEVYPKFNWQVVQKYYMDRDSSGAIAVKNPLLMTLIALRKNKTTQVEIAKKMGVHQSAIARFERGEHSPSIDFVQNYALALGCEIGILN